MGRMGYGCGGEREIIYPSVCCHHQNDSCIKVGSDESHFIVSVGSDGQSHKTVSTNHNLFEKKGEPKRYLTEWWHRRFPANTAVNLFFNLTFQIHPTNTTRKLTVVVFHSICNGSELL